MAGRLTSTAAILFLGIECGFVAAGGRTRLHAPASPASSIKSVRGAHLRGSSLPSPPQSPLPPPTRNPTTLHPTTREWAGGADYQTNFPTKYPSTIPTYDHESEYPTSGSSSYVPTEEHLFPNIIVRSGMNMNRGNGDDEADPTDDCGPDRQFFQLDLHTDYYSCETSWSLERLLDDAIPGGGSSVVVDEHEGYYYDTSYAGASSRCLENGRYRFTIHDAFGDGMQSPGYYVLALDGDVFAGSSDFGYEEVTQFVVGGLAGPILDSGDESVDTVMEEMISSSSPENGTVTTHNQANMRPSGLERPMSYINLEQHTTSVSSAQPHTSSPMNDQSTIPIIANSMEEDVSQSPPPPPSSPQSTWIELISDDFEVSYNGMFHQGSNDYVSFYPYVMERRGVYRIQNGLDLSSSLYSDNIPLLDHPTTTTSRSSSPSPIGDDIEREIKVVFSYYANSMEAADGFCLDASIDDGESWHSRRCWHSRNDFTNGVWYDEEAVSFRLKRQQGSHHHIMPSGDDEKDDVVDGLRIRFRCKGNSDMDDLLIDKVQVLEKGLLLDDGEGMTRAVELKDSKT